MYDMMMCIVKSEIEKVEVHILHLNRWDLRLAISSSSE